MKQPFFIVGGGRSGTTYLYRLLALHPQVALTNEAHVADFLKFTVDYAGIPSFDPMSHVWQVPTVVHGMVGRPYAQRFQRVFTRHALAALEAFYREEFADREFTHWGDKLPEPATAVALQEVYPHAKYVVLLRDPRDVVCSVRAFAERDDVRAANPFFGTSSLTGVCENWHNTYHGLLTYLRDRLPVRYEQLVVEPEATIDAIQRYLELPIATDLVAQIAATDSFESHGTSRSPASSIGRWRRDLSAQDLAAIEDICGGVMRQFGYELAGSATT